MKGREPAAALLIAGLLAAAALPAAAALGEDAASIQADQLRAAARRVQVRQLDGEVHTLSLADGSSIRQYVGRDGRVYAVSWNTRFKPRLDQLLGRHHAAYAEAGRQAQQLRPGVNHGAALRNGDLVVESTAHLNAFVGRAWLRSMLPPGSALDAIR